MQYLLVPVLFWHLLKITPWDYQEILLLRVSTPEIRMVWTSLYLTTICSQEKLHLYIFVCILYRSFIAIPQGGGGTIFQLFTRMLSAQCVPSNIRCTVTKEIKESAVCTASSLLTEQRKECSSVFQHIYLSCKTSDYCQNLSASLGRG